MLRCKTTIKVKCYIKEIHVERLNDWHDCDYYKISVGYRYLISGMKERISEVTLNEKDYLFGGVKKMIRIVGDIEKLKKLIKKDLLSILKRAKKESFRSVCLEEVQNEIGRLNNELAGKEIEIEITI